MIVVLVLLVTVKSQHKIPAAVPHQDPEFTHGRGALTNCPLELRTSYFQFLEFVQVLVIPL